MIYRDDKTQDPLWIDMMCQYRPLPRRTEQVLAKVIENGGEYAYTARVKLLKANIRYAYYYAGKLPQFKEIYDDIVAIIFDAMWTATETFRPVGVKFTVYATKRIKWNLRRTLLREWNKVSLTSSSYQSIGEISSWISRYWGEHHHYPTAEEIAEEFGKCRADGFFASRKTPSLDEEFISRDTDAGAHADTTYKDLLVYENGGIPQSDQNCLDGDEQSVLRSLIDNWKMGAEKSYERNRSVIRSRFYDGETLEVIGKRLGVTRERVRQIEATFIHDIRTKKEYKWFRDEYRNIFSGLEIDPAQPVGSTRQSRTTSREIFIYPE